jgi:hypothetical protein
LPFSSTPVAGAGDQCVAALSLLALRRVGVVLLLPLSAAAAAAAAVAAEVAVASDVKDVAPSGATLS